MNDSGTSKPAPAASGMLAKTPLLHLLLYALDKKLTGSIELVSFDERSAAIVFAEGQPTKVRTSEPVAYLGQVMRDLGFVSEAQLDRSLSELAREKGRGHKLHGELLVEQNVVDADQLRAALREQVARKVRHVAALPPETAYEYFEAFDSLAGWGGADWPRIDPMPHLWSIVRASPPMDHVAAAMARVGSMALRLARGLDAARLGLVGSDEKRALELLRARPMRVETLAAVSAIGQRDAQLLAYLLVVTKQVELVQPTDSPLPTATQHAVAEALREAKTRSTPPPPMRISQPVPVPAARISQPPAEGRASQPPPSLSPQLAARWREITDRAATIDKNDYFTMLGLARDASDEQVADAFITLAKRWHPDRLPPELAPVRDACSRVFARMGEAHATLVDEEQRGRYMRLLVDGSGTPEAQETVARVVEAATDFQKAEVLFRRNDLAQSEALCRKAHDADPTQPDYLALLAWLVALKPESQSGDATLDCIRMLDRAVELNERCEKALYWRGMLYKRLGKTEVAAKDFRRAVDVNPRNIEAAREVRLFEMRGGDTRPRMPANATPAKGEKMGLFGKLFKK